jgi:von Willebrand factor type A domain
MYDGPNMARLPGALLALFLTGAGVSQGDRAVVFVDGRGEDLVTVHGRGRWIQDPGRVRVGVAALRIERTPTEKYPGFSISNVPSRGAQALVLGIYLEGDTPRNYRVRLDDDQTSNATDDVAIDYQTLEPGWNAVVVSLQDRKTVKERPMSFPAVVRKLQFTKKNEERDPAIVLDSVSLRGAPPPERDRRALIDAYAAEKDVSRKAKLLKEIGALPDTDLAWIAIDLLKREKEPRLRRIAREELARVSTPEVALTVADGLKEIPMPERLEVLWAVAAMPCSQTRQRALGWVRDQRLPGGERTALLTGLRLAGGADVRALLGDLPPQTAWPLRAALVSAIRSVSEPESVDALIAILGEPGSARVADDAETALGALTGGDYGADAATWRDWWRVNRDKVPLGVKSKQKQASYGRSTFYGLAVPQGRVAFVVDTSGSMAESVSGGRLAEYIKTAAHLSPTGIKTRLDLAVAELSHAIMNMKVGSSVAVISFSAAERWETKGFETVTQEQRAKIGEKVHRLTAGRSTNVYAGMYAAFHPEGKPRPQDLVEGPDTIFLLTDGNPSSGKLVDVNDLRDEILAWNLSRAIKIHCVNVGDADARLLTALSIGSGGTLVDLRSDHNPPEPPK